MLALAATLAYAPHLLVLRERNFGIELVEQRGANVVRIIHREPLNMRRKLRDDELDAEGFYFYYAMLELNTCVIVDPVRKRIGYLHITSADPNGSPLQTRYWIVGEAIDTFDYEGNRLSRQAYELVSPYQFGNQVLFFADNGMAMGALCGDKWAILGRPDIRLPAKWQPNGWEEMTKWPDEAGWKALRVGFANVLGLATIKVVPTVEPQMSGEDMWVADRNRNAYGVYNSERFSSDWEGRQVYRTFGSAEYLEHPYFLDYPWIVGRRRFGEMQKNVFDGGLMPKPAYRDYYVNGSDPFVESKIFLYNLVSGEEQCLGNGIFAYPM